MLEFNKNTMYLIPKQDKPVKVIFEDFPCPVNLSIHCKYSEFDFKDLEATISCDNCYKNGCYLLERSENLNMENKITINTKYYYDSSIPLTYEELKKLGIGAMVWCEYSSDWTCKVENEIKTIVRDLEFPPEIDLRGSFCCIGDLKATMNRNKMTVKVYELNKIQ